MTTTVMHKMDDGGQCYHTGANREEAEQAKEECSG